MIVRFLEITEYEKWDKFVSKSPQGFIFNKSYWLEIVCNKDFKICILENKEEIFAGIALPFFSKKKINMPMTTQSLGILFRSMDELKEQKRLTNEKEYTNLLMDFILKEIKQFNINFNPKYNYWLPLYWKGFNTTVRSTYYINYNNINLEKLFQSFSKGHKWTLNKLKKNEELIISETDDIEDIYDVLSSTYKRQNTKIGYSKEFLKNMINILKDKNEIKIFKTFNRNDKITQAIVIFIYNEDEAYYWLGGSNDKYRNDGTHTYLIWYAINYFADKTKEFNFGGSMIEEVEKNFRNFSPQLKNYYNIYWHKSWIIHYMKQALKCFIKEIAR